jgi:hypothetical protein
MDPADRDVAERLLNKDRTFGMTYKVGGAWGGVAEDEGGGAGAPGALWHAAAAGLRVHQNDPCSNPCCLSRFTEPAI